MHKLKFLNKVEVFVAECIQYYINKTQTVEKQMTNVTYVILMARRI